MTKKVKRKARVIKHVAQVNDVPVLVPIGHEHDVENPDPEVRLVRKDDGGTWIEVSCSCGRTIMVECLNE